MYGHQYTAEERQFMTEYVPGHSYREIIPTAYDVDKVVEQIKKATDEHGLVDYINDKPVIKKEKAIEIVKVGGKYE